MTDSIFLSYSEATSFAKLWARELGASVAVRRHEGGWSVYRGSAPKSSPPGIDRQVKMGEEKWYQEQSADHVAYQIAIKAKVEICEACDRPISFCRC